MRWMEVLQEVRLMRFEETYGYWKKKSLSQDGWRAQFSF